MIKFLKSSLANVWGIFWGKNIILIEMGEIWLRKKSYILNI